MEWRACLFFPTVKLVCFYNFWGLRHQKWTFCCRVACVHYFFLRKTHAFFPNWTSNRDSAAEWRASFFFALVKLQCFVLISAVLGGKMCLFVNMAGNGQNLPPGDPPGPISGQSSEINKIGVLGISWGHLVGQVRNCSKSDFWGPPGANWWAKPPMIKIGLLGISWVPPGAIWRARLGNG